MSHMYSRAKIREIQSRMDARWKTEEKLQLYRGILTIFGRENKKQINEANKVRRQQALQLKELHKDCWYFRRSLGDIMYGNKQRLRNALQPNRIIQLCYQRLWPSKAIEYFVYANNKKQKEYDLIRYKKTKRMELFTNLKLERAEIHDRLEIGFENVKFRRAVQVLTNRLEMFVVRQNAAAQVYKLYKNMLNLLKNDSHYFDAILVIIHAATLEQSRCVLQAAELGQLAAEDLVDIRGDYKWLEKEVKVNMKERRREVAHIRKVAEDLLLRCKMMTSAESYNYAYKTSATGSMFGEGDIHTETVELECLMRKVQDATNTPTFFDIFPRMLEQLRQEESLIRTLQKMSVARDHVLRMKSHSDMLLSMLMYTETASVLHYKEKKGDLEREMKEETYRLDQEREAIEDFGRILASLKTALQALYEIVHRLKEVPLAEYTESASELDVEIQPDLTPEEIEATFPPPLDQNPKMLLRKITDGLTFFHIYASESLDEETLRDATVEHQNKILLERSSLGPIVEADVPLFEELEAEDAAVKSREQMKLQSKQLVEEHERLVMIAEMGPAALAKMRRRM